MNKFSIIGNLLILLFLSCNKESDSFDNLYVAKIVGFDLNCSTCIVTFPDDSLTIKKVLGESQNNYYQTVNLDKNNFKIGQKLKVKVRKAEDIELRACITLYPSFNYENIYVSDYENYRDFTYNDTIYLSYKDSLIDPDRKCCIKFDSVLTDSRCPVGLICIWGGEAIARFKFEKSDSESILVDLYVSTLDTIIDGYKFSFIDLFPYPKFENQIKLQDYKAKIVIKQK